MSLDPESYWQQLLRRSHACPPQPRADPLARAYLDFAAPGEVVLGHLGQSLDGQIATATGHSANVTGPANIRHLHRLRALADAVLVGAATVRHDNPSLTTRLVEGPSPVRIVIDSRRRLGRDHRLFQDGPPTLVLCAEDAVDAPSLGRAEIVPVDADGGRVRPAAVLAVLRARGLRRLFIEGGGVTVSRFLFAGCLDILEICVSPLILGRGRPGSAGRRSRVDEALRLHACSVILMGEDVLFRGTSLEQVRSPGVT